MLIASSKLYHLPILDPDTHARLGTVERLIFDVELGKLAALGMQTNGLVNHALYIAARDIVSFEPHALLCNSEALSSLRELPRVQQLIAQHTPLLNQLAVTTAEKSLGRVKEVMFDDSSYLILQIHTRHLFDSRIFGRDSLQKVTRRRVIIDDDAATELESALAGKTAHA